MQESRSRLTDDLARMFNDAANLAGGVRKEVETIVRTQMERFLSTMDVVTREEFEAVRDMAALAREENEKLAKKIEELEAKLAQKWIRAARLPTAGPRKSALSLCNGF